MSWEESIERGLNGISSLLQGVVGQRATCPFCLLCEDPIDYHKTDSSKIRTYYFGNGIGKVHKKYSHPQRRRDMGRAIEESLAIVSNPQGKCAYCVEYTLICDQQPPCISCAKSGALRWYSSSDYVSAL